MRHFWLLSSRFSNKPITEIYANIHVIDFPLERNKLQENMKKRRTTPSFIIFMYNSCLLCSGMNVLQSRFRFQPCVNFFFRISMHWILRLFLTRLIFWLKDEQGNPHVLDSIFLLNCAFDKRGSLGLKLIQDVVKGPSPGLAFPQVNDRAS